CAIKSALPLATRPSARKDRARAYTSRTNRTNESWLPRSGRARLRSGGASQRAHNLLYAPGAATVAPPRPSPQGVEEGLEPRSRTFHWEASVSHEVPFENLDRLLAVEMRRNGLPQGVMPRVYAVARGDGPPLTQKAVEDLNAVSGTVGFLTGVYFPPHFEMGEVDGPIGAVVLGSVLAKLGRRAEVVIEERLVPL